MDIGQNIVSAKRCTALASSPSVCLSVFNVTYGGHMC